MLFISDAAPYMIKAGKYLEASFPRLIHITYLAHSIHRVCEKIRENYRQVDHLISNVKNIFLKAPYRIQKLKAMCPDLSLPPEPVITKWGTWINAALYYGSNFEAIKLVVDSLEEEDVNSIKVAKILL